MPIRRHISVIAALVLMPAAWAGAPVPARQDLSSTKHAVKLQYRDEYGAGRSTVESVRGGAWPANGLQQ